MSPLKKHIHSALPYVLCLAFFVLLVSEVRWLSTTNQAASLVLARVSFYGFCAALLAWLALVVGKNRAGYGLLSVVVISAFCTYVLAFLLRQTSFGLNAYYADANYQVSMIHKAMVYGWGRDYAFASLSTFYPPLTFYLGAKAGALAGLNPHEVYKASHLALVLLAAPIGYVLWARSLPVVIAVIVAVFAALWGISSHLYKPHEWLAVCIFVPWWVHWIDTQKPMSLHKVILGAVVGAAAFCTYYYPFFMGGVVFLVSIVMSWFEIVPRSSRLWFESW